MNSSIVTKFIDKARKIRLELKETIDELLKLQLKNELNLDGKETLIRFLFIDSSVEKGLLLIDNSIVDKGSHHPSMLLQGAEDEKNKYSLYKSDSHLSDDGKLKLRDNTTFHLMLHRLQYRDLLPEPTLTH